ncbi:MAG: protein kinase [Thermoanaerobaculaceae bacterium]
MQPGTRLGPYEIIALLGTGGMGEVYKAKDTRLDRVVAVKVLLGRHAEDPAMRERFEREARAISALSHPSICTLHDIGEHEGTHFLVMEYLEGETLAARLARGPLPLDQALELGREIAVALAAAHDRGIVHRDLKPGNVMLTKGGPKLLDFGLAKLHAASHGILDLATQETASGSLTEQGAILGTLHYMAPEQLEGREADARSDIFAFGCLLYEMISGRRAFAGEAQANVIAAILKGEPAELSDLVKSLPPVVDHIVKHCLQKDRDDRFQTAKDIVFALSQASAPAMTNRPPEVAAPPVPERGRNKHRWQVAGGVALVGVAAVSLLVWRGKGPQESSPVTPSFLTAKPARIVVLPFENLGAPEDAYFAAGMTEEITSRLANVHGLDVISRTSALEYTRRGKTVKEIGSELGVDYVLEGSVRWERGQGHESRVRISPQLIRVADDTQVWADRYDRVIADVFAIQSEVAENAVKAMGVTLLPHEQTTLKEVSTNDLEAYDLYLRGQELAKGGEDRRHVEGALQKFQAAVDRDPRFAQALAGLARSHLFMYWFYIDRDPDRLVKAKEAAERAVELRPDLAETHTALGFFFYQGLLDYPRALEEFNAALKIRPNSGDALAAVAYVLRRQGHWADSAEHLTKALELDPKNAELLANLGETCGLARRYADADHAYVLAIAQSPQWAELYAEEAWLQLQWHGDVQKAQAVLDEAGQVAGLTDATGVIPWSALELALFRRDFQKALRQLESMTRNASEDQLQYLPIPLLRGQVQMLAGEHDLARRSFEAARLELEQKVAQDPADARFHSSLGIAYAGLGRRVEAAREAKRGYELMPASKDAYRALARLEDLALVYTMIGQTSEAISHLDDLLARSGEFTVHLLRLDPRWDPLRSDPRFQALLTKYQVKP